ncbi:MAG: hypothetical protein U1D67_09915, partial [Dehalococcoidia bacterium]|nr:hypothetical protein [Dehalococcoidia bacterium]
MAINSNAPKPRIPKATRITSVEQLLPTARDMVSKEASHMYEGVLVNKGTKVLFVNDPTADQLVVESLTIAMRERGANVTTINLEGFPGLKDPVDMLDNMFSNNWYPDWVWDAAKQTDVLLITAFIKEAHTPHPELPKNIFVDNLEMTADLMVSEYEKFPPEIRDKIDEVAWENLENCTKVKWTDLEGTDINISPTAEEWAKATRRHKERTGRPYMHGHLMLPAPCEVMSGVFVTSSITFGGPIPRTTFTIEKGKAVKVEGGGKYGDRVRESFTKYANLHKSKCPGPGVNWMTTIGICTHPKAQRSPFFDELAGSARVYAWTF